MCKHKFERIEYRDNEYKFIEIYWCPLCGALKRKETYQGGERKITIRVPEKDLL